jgi:hypothetical protein
MKVLCCCCRLFTVRCVFLSYLNVLIINVLLLVRISTGLNVFLLHGILSCPLSHFPLHLIIHIPFLPQLIFPASNCPHNTYFCTDISKLIVQDIALCIPSQLSISPNPFIFTLTFIVRHITPFMSSSAHYSLHPPFSKSLLILLYNVCKLLSLTVAFIFSLSVSAYPQLLIRVYLFIIPSILPITPHAQIFQFMLISIYETVSSLFSSLAQCVL